MFRCCCCKYRPHPTVQMPCQIPLKSVSFSANVQNSLVNLSIFQTFINEEQKPLESEYMFFVPDESVITSLKIHLNDGTVLTARVEPAEKAAETYQDSIAEGNTVALGKIEDDEKMTILIGNLAPNDSVRVEFTLVFPLSAHKSFWKLSIPAGFLPSNDYDSILSFNFSLQILSQFPITQYSSNCFLDFQLSPDTLLLQGSLPADTYKKFSNKHLWVKFRSSETNTPSCILQQIGSKYLGMLSFIPFNSTIESLDEVEGQGEYIFVLDRSGSMQGNRIEMAKQAAKLFINSLPTGSLFNIVSFGGHFEFMYRESQQNTSYFVKNAINKVSCFTANMGGTNIHGPLKQIFSSVPVKGLPRTIFLLTDGQVKFPGIVIDIISKNSGNCRVHGFGIGEDVDVSLIKKSAKAGKGSASFITNTEDIGKNVIGALQKCIFPCVSQWRIDWNGECYPNTDKIGSLYYGERCIQYVMLDEKPSRAVNIRFFDNFTKDIKEFSLSNFQEVPGDSLLKLWSKGKLDYLLENSDRDENQIIQLSIESGIPTKLTSFICVIENDEPVTEEMAIRKTSYSQNQLLIAYLRYTSNNSQQICGLSSAAGIKRKCKKVLREELKIEPETFRKSMISSYSSKNVRSLGISKVETETKEKKVLKVPKSEKESEVNHSFGRGQSLYLKIVGKIEAEGFWVYQDFITELPGIKSIPLGLVDCSDKENVICTLFVLGFLHKNFEEKFDEWVLVERKALKWLRSRGVLFKDLHETVKAYIM